MEWIENIPLSPLTTLKIGGNARYFFEGKEKKDFPILAHHIQKKKLPYCVLGGGSNIYFSDKGFDGFVFKNSIHFLEKTSNISHDKNLEQKSLIQVGAGTPLSVVVFQTQKWGFTGLESLAGIPGTIGGAVYGNAGVPTKEIGDTVFQAEVFDILQEKFLTLQKEELSFSYRSSIFQTHPEWILTELCLQLNEQSSSQPNNHESAQWIQERASKQPSGMTAGSFFKNPSKKQSAGYLLDQVGAKGERVGGAVVSDIHANFFMNDGTATAQDMETLAKTLEKRVFESFGISLEREVKQMQEILLFS